MFKLRIRTALPLLLLCLALVLAAIALWLNRHPEMLLGMLNRQLPAVTAPPSMCLRAWLRRVATSVSL